MCYPAKFRRYRSNRLGVGRRSQKWGKALGPAPLKWGRWLTPKTRYYPVCVIIPNFVAVGQTVGSRSVRNICRLKTCEKEVSTTPSAIEHEMVSGLKPEGTLYLYL